MKKVIFLIILFIDTNLLANSFPLFEKTNDGYKDGFAFAEKHGLELGREYLFEVAKKTLVYNLIVPVTYITSFTMYMLLISKENFETSYCLYATFLPVTCLSIIVFDLPIIYTEIEINRIYNLNKNCKRMIQDENNSIIYKQEFIKGVERYLRDKKRR